MANYKTLISKDESSKKAEDINFAVEEASQQMQADILATKKQIATCGRELTNAKSAFPFSPKAVLEKQVELEGYEKGLEYLLKINEELFGKEDVADAVSLKA